MPSKSITPIERFLSKLIIKESGCWEWIGGRSGAGYGELRTGGNRIKAHRFSYEWFKGKIPDGLQIDHLCRNHKCVNPDHLEVVTNRDNTIRGIGITAKNAIATYCQNGHKFDLFNTYFRLTGGRDCIKCKRKRTRESNRRIYAKKKLTPAPNLEE